MKSPSEGWGDMLYSRAIGWRELPSEETER